MRLELVGIHMAADWHVHTHRVHSFNLLDTHELDATSLCPAQGQWSHQHGQHVCPSWAL